MKRSLIKFAVALGVVFIQGTANAGTGNLFNVTATGTLGNINMTLCLDATSQLSCQNYTASASDLSITTTIPNHTYPNAGIKVTTPGYALSGCTTLSNGFCQFSVSNSTPKNITIGPATLYGVTGHNGAMQLSLFTVNTSTGFPTFVMPLIEANDGSIIASDGNSLYSFQQTAMQSINLNTLTSTIIPLSGASYSEPFGAVFFKSSNAFLVQKRSSQEFMSVTTGGVVSLIAANTRRRGFACYQHNIYGVKEDSPFELNQINPATGAILSTVTLTLPDHIINNALSLTVDPTTGIFYALLKIDYNNIRTLTTVDISTGVATIVGNIDEGSDIYISSIAFHPADTSC
jgi:hypothetical protein